MRVRVGVHALVRDQPHRAGGQPLPVGSAVRLGLNIAQVRLFAN